LRDYAANAQLIDRRKLAGKALSMFESSPDEFIRLVKGNNPDAVEKVFGPGSFNIFKEMGADIRPMQQIADELTRDIKIAEQAKAGAKALGFEDESLAKKIPGFVGYKTAILKQVIRTLENKISSKTVDVLANAAKSGKSMNEILDTLPADERFKVLKALKDISNVAQSGAASLITTPPTNALAPEQQNQNALAR
jgi:predicted Zn-ribbon and HTH transcriptional regulator